MMQQYHVELASYRLVGWVVVSFFTVCAIASFVSGERGSSIWFILFVLFGVYLILGAGHFEMDHDRLVHRSAFGEWQIHWDEIIAVEVGSGGGTFVLRGDSKAFVLSPPGWWTGAAREATWRFLQQQLQRRGLEPLMSRTADCAIMRNTRVRAMRGT